jgi:hypothetical protein
MVKTIRQGGLLQRGQIRRTKYSARSCDTYFLRLSLYFCPSSFNVGGAVWHFVHGWPVCCAIFGVAIVCRDVTAIIALAINITANVPATRDKITLIVFEFRIAELLTIASTDTDFLTCISCPGLLASDTHFLRSNPARSFHLSNIRSAGEALAQHDGRVHDVGMAVDAGRLTLLKRGV